MTEKRDEHVHLPSKTEFFLAILIVIVLIISLISQISQKLFDIPRYITVILIILFLSLKIHHILWMKKRALLEDYTATGIIALFLLLYLILKENINPALTTIFIFILIYSTGLMLWIKKTFESRRIIHFLISYVTSVIIVILLFAGVYASGAGVFSDRGIEKHLSFQDSLYVSIITFTTVGYGDIAPLGINRLFVSIEAILGLIINIALIGYILASGRYNRVD
ncbi:MAG: potassium channel family protein [Nanoarchaeota archaeon]